MTIHEGLSVNSADQLTALLKKGVVFRNCSFDQADLANFQAEEMKIEHCSLRDADFSNLACRSLRIASSNLERASFEKADIHEAEKLAALVNDWGLSQLNSIAGIVKTQINIIGRLEELVSSNKAYEIDLHKLVERNLWLVREGLELWSSDKPLKTLLDGHVDQVYKGRKDIRPRTSRRWRSVSRWVLLRAPGRLTSGPWWTLMSAASR